MAPGNQDSQLPPPNPSRSPEICVPSTPPPAEALEHDHARQLDRSAFVSPRPRSISADLTPPPSTQPGRVKSPATRPQASHSEHFLASPPDTVRGHAMGVLPTLDVVAKAEADELRSMAQDLILAVREARMSAAHFKLQHSLLTIESQESAQRAEVEHQMTRREVEVLQAAEHRHRVSLSMTSRASQPPAQPQIDSLTKTCSELAADKEDLERKLRRAKKLIEQEKDKTELLLEENLLLKKRIRENREHFSRMKSQSPIYSTPRNEFMTPQRKAAPRFADSARSHAPFAALLAADQVLSGESVSVPSTPTKTQPPKFRQGHMRGAHSLSSLQSTPARSRPATADGVYFENRNGLDAHLSYSAPVSQVINESAERDRHHRDSTISVSDEEEAVTDEDIPPSQASSLATNMLRRNPGSQESSNMTASTEKSSNLLQTKLFGPVKKSGVERSTPQGKRHASFGEADISAKRARMGEGVGLGIGAWKSPRA